MNFFDKVDPKTLDRRHWQLSMLSLGMIIVLGAGVVLLMYPVVFGSYAVPTGPPSRTLFFGFCALFARISSSRKRKSRTSVRRRALIC